MHPRFRFLVGLLAVAVIALVFCDAPTAAAGPHERCADCHHEQARSGFGAPDYRVCLRCHDPELPSRAAAMTASGRSAIYGHRVSAERAPAAVPPGGSRAVTVDCLSCHAAHPNDRPYQLVARGDPSRVDGRTVLDAATESCLRCHTAFGNFEGDGGEYTLHPVGIPVDGEGLQSPDRWTLPLTDVRGTVDPLDDVISCLTCHEPHASSHRYALRWDHAEMAAACTTCHRVGPDLGVDDRLVAAVASRSSVGSTVAASGSGPAGP